MKVLIMMPERLQRATSSRVSLNDQGIEAEGAFVNASIGQRQRRRLAVGDHDNLLHVFALAGEDAL